MPQPTELERWLLWIWASLRLPEALGEPELRACTACAARQLTGKVRCLACDAPTAGLDLVSVASGRDASAQKHQNDVDLARRVLVRVLSAVWIVLGLRFIWEVYGAGPLRVVFEVFITAIVGIVLHGGIVFIARTILAQLAPKGLDAVASGAASRLEAAATELVEPFLARNGIGEGVPARVPLPEADLLKRALGERHIEVQDTEVEPLLTACALRREVFAFRAQLSRVIDEKPGFDTVRAYAFLVPAVEDRAKLPLLRHLLRGEGDRAELPVVTALVQKIREDLRLQGFVSDLEQRRAQPSVKVTIEAIDAMDPIAFEDLVAMVFETQGYTLNREEADLLLEKAGERTALGIHHGNEPLAPPAIQEVVSARAFNRCQHAMVVTNGEVVTAAQELAHQANVRVVDRRGLGEMLAAFNGAAKDYERLARVLKPR